MHYKDRKTPYDYCLLLKMNNVVFCLSWWDTWHKRQSCLDIHLTCMNWPRCDDIGFHGCRWSIHFISYYTVLIYCTFSLLTIYPSDMYAILSCTMTKILLQAPNIQHYWMRIISDETYTTWTSKYKGLCSWQMSPLPLFLPIYTSKLTWWKGMEGKANLSLPLPPSFQRVRA